MSHLLLTEPWLEPKRTEEGVSLEPERSRVELSLLFSDDVSFSLEALAVSEGADGAVEELPWDDLFPVSVLASASASC